MPEFLPEDSAGEALPQSDRLQILSPEEYELLWGFPCFTQSDRDLFFTLTAPERGAVEQCRSVRTKIHLLLHLGYFRARQRFFRFELPAVRDDVDHLRRRYFDNVSVADLAVSLHTRQRHIEVVLGLFRYRSCALAERVIEQVELSAESVRYFASLVEFYTVYKLKRMDREAVRLYLLCFSTTVTSGSTTTCSAPSVPWCGATSSRRSMRPPIPPDVWEFV